MDKNLFKKSDDGRGGAISGAARFQQSISSLSRAHVVAWQKMSKQINPAMLNITQGISDVLTSPVIQFHCGRVWKLSGGFADFALIAMSMRGGGRNQKSVRADFGSAV